MEPHDEICLCFHVTKRKIVNFLHVEKPRRVSQISECFGAGTGCGWCRPFLQRFFDQAAAQGEVVVDEPDREEYARLRASYISAGRGTPPPGAAPQDPPPGDESSR